MTAPASENEKPLELELELEPVSANAAVARQAVEDLAASLGIEAVAAAARLVVTEAFTNAARHAYPNGHRAPITVRASGCGGALEISVRDRGSGIRPRPAAGPGGRLGLLMIAAVSDWMRISCVPDGGTEVRAKVSGRTVLAEDG